MKVPEKNVKNDQKVRDSAGMIRGKTAIGGTQGPMKKRADLLLVRNSQGRDTRTQGEKSGPTAGKREQPTAGKNWRRLVAAGRPRADEWREWHTRAMMRNRWENKVKSLTADALRGVNSTIFDAEGNRIDNELGKRDYMTVTALEQG